MNQRSRWLIYALGGGLGHLTRGVALARAAGKVGHSVCLLTNSAYAALLDLQDELGASATTVVLDSTLDRTQTAAAVQDVLAGQPFDVLVVDTFPRGLGGELVEALDGLNCLKVLVHRDLNPRYVARFDLARFVRRYHLIVLPGESAVFGCMPQARLTRPWLVRDHDELLQLGAARHALMADDDERPLVAVVDGGSPQESRENAGLAMHMTKQLDDLACIRFVSSMAKAWPESGVRSLSFWPLLAAMPAVSVVVGAGGYNTVHEARATDTPLVAIARKRLYDRQERRLRTDELVERPLEAIDRVRSTIRAPLRRSAFRTPGYVNGTHQAIRIIERALSTALQSVHNERDPYRNDSVH